MKIKNIETNGDHGYLFEVESAEIVMRGGLLEEVVTREYKTNRDGSGLFVKTRNGPSVDWRQIRGTAQFSLRGIKNVRGKIRRELRTEEF